MWLNPIILFGLFLILGIGYGAGLKWFFRYNFRWSLASTLGIMIVVCTTALLDWIPTYGYDTATAIVVSLFFPFAGALYGMIDFDRTLREDREQDRAYIKELERRIRELS